MLLRAAWDDLLRCRHPHLALAYTPPLVTIL